jgi:Flp pilus assembly protein TadG
MICVRLARQRRRAVATVEFALLLPFIMILLLGIWEVGRIADVSGIVNNAAREGARQASTGLVTNSQVTADVQFYISQAFQGQGMPSAAAQQAANDAIITVQNLTHPGTDVSNATELDELLVIVSIPYGDVRWSAISLTANSSTRITGQACWFSMKDQQYPAAVTAPSGF